MADPGPAPVDSPWITLRQRRLDRAGLLHHVSCFTKKIIRPKGAVGQWNNLPNNTGKRGEAWLRGLVGLGFLAEGRWLRIEAPTCRCGLGTSRTRAPTNPYAQNLERTRGEKAARGLPAPVTLVDSAAAIPAAVDLSADAGPVPEAPGEPGAKPLAHLARVIG